MIITILPPNLSEGWNFNTAYRFNIIHIPDQGLIRLKLYEGTTLLHDTSITDNGPEALKGGRLGVYCDSQENIRWSALSYRCATSSTSTSRMNLNLKYEQRVTEGTYFDWCEKEGCLNGGSDSSYILSQKVSPSRRRRQEVVEGCADLKLTESNELTYTLIDCADKRKPLCMRGDPIIDNQRKRMQPRRNRIEQRKKDLKKKQIRGKTLWRKINRNKKRKGRQLLRQEPSPPVDMCVTAGRFHC